MLANARAERYLGIANGDRLERREITEFLFQLETSEAGNWPNILHGVMVDGKPAELSARAPNGLQLLIQLSSFAYNPEMNRGLLISLADVSALRESERQRGELTAFISHDLRSPLSSIVAIAGIARADPRRIGEAMIERIENHAYRTLALVDDVLEFNRLQTAEWKEFRNVNLSAAAYQAIDSVSDRIAAREIKLFRRLPDEAIVTGDDALIERAVINLLDNAIKYSPPNSEITVEIRETEDDMRCTVSDTGYGIPDEDLHKIFERYQRSSSNHHARQPGVGLGLSFVRVCMERHRGRVDVETQVDQGTSFTLVFPRADG
jgi:signal transduction histidine kinase